MKIGITSVFVHDPVSAFRFHTTVLGFVKKVFIPEKWIAIVVSAEEPEGTSLMLEPNTTLSQIDISKRYTRLAFRSLCSRHRILNKSTKDW